jgi:hypothetical protein
MKKIFLTLAIVAFVVSCGKDTTSNMTVTGTIDGLKKGTLYLQKLQDTILVVADSVVINGDSNYTLKTNITEPEIFYLYLNKKDGNELNDRITFFGEPGTITINTSRELFEVDATISGSEIHKKLEEYNKGKSRYKGFNLDLVKAALEARIDSNMAAVDSINRAIDKNTMRSYLYTINYALNNKDSEIAPYIMLAEGYDAQLKYLDTVQNSLTPKIADSKYGVMLKEFIEKVRTPDKK